MTAGAPPPGTLQKRPRATTEWQRRLEWARQPTGGWKAGDFCMTPSGKLSRVVAVEKGLLLQYVRESGVAYSAQSVDVALQPHLCRWLSPREMRDLKRPDQGNQNNTTDGGADAAA